MDADALRGFIEENHRAVLSTLRPDGRAHLSPVLVAIDAEGRAIVSSSENRLKVRNLRRDPRATVCVITERFFGKWAYLDGTAEVVSLPEAMEPLVDYYRRVRGAHPNWDEYRRAMEQERRVLIMISIDRRGPKG